MAGFLLDTHVLLWAIQEDPKLSDQARKILLDSSNQLYFSAASLWEITIKLNIGKLKLDESIDSLYGLLEQFGIAILPISQQALEEYLKLPLHHRDPFDRMLIAQAIAYELVLVSADAAMVAYPVQQVW